MPGAGLVAPHGRLSTTFETPFLRHHKGKDWFDLYFYSVERLHVPDTRNTRGEVVRPPPLC